MPPPKRDKSVRKVAKEIGVSETQAYRYLDEGMPTSGAARDQWLQSRRGGGTQGDAAAEAKLARALAEAAKLEKQVALADAKLNQLAGQWVDRDAVLRTWTLHISDARARLETLPALVASLLPEGPHRELIRGEVERLVSEVLRGLARGAISDGA